MSDLDKALISSRILENRFIRKMKEFKKVRLMSEFYKKHYEQQTRVTEVLSQKKGIKEFQEVLNGQVRKIN